jgi:hypothetical protein
MGWSTCGSPERVEQGRLHHEAVRDPLPARSGAATTALASGRNTDPAAEGREAARVKLNFPATVTEYLDDRDPSP